MSQPSSRGRARREGCPIGIARWNYRRKIAGPLSHAGDELRDTIRAAPVDGDFKSVLSATVQAAGFAVFDFGTVARELVTKDAAEPALKGFVDALPRSGPALAALRIAEWAYIARVVAKNWGQRYEDVIGVAEAALSVEGDYEHRLAHFGPFSGGKEDQDAQFFQFNRYTVEGLVAAATGLPVEKGDLLPSVVTWAELFASRFAVFDQLMEGQKSPDG